MFTANDFSMEHKPDVSRRWVDMDELRAWSVLTGPGGHVDTPIWYDHRITREAVREAIQAGELEPQSWHDWENHGDDGSRVKDWQRHVRRIAYLVLHPETAAPVDLYYDGSVGGINDGYHRIAAADFRGDLFIEARP